MKYIVYSNGLYNLPIIFPKLLEHRMVDQAMSSMMAMSSMLAVNKMEAVSAGFVILPECTCHGESATMGLKSREADTLIIQMMSYTYGMVDQEHQIAALLSQTHKQRRDNMAERAKEEMEELYNKFFNLRHELAVQEAGLKNILCDALGIEAYQHSLYELVKMAVPHITKEAINTEEQTPIKWTLGDCLDMETIAKELHEAGRAAVERGATVAADKGDQSRHFIEWDDITENAREGRRIQALYLLNKYDVVPKVIEPKTFGSAI